MGDDRDKKAAKLEGLWKLASDERTPVEEARNAALAFVRGGGGLPDAQDVLKLAEAAKLAERLKAVEAEVAALRADADARLVKHAQMRERANIAEAERDAARAQLAELSSAVAVILKHASAGRPAAPQSRAEAQAGAASAGVGANPFADWPHNFNPFRGGAR